MLTNKHNTTQHNTHVHRVHEALVEDQADNLDGCGAECEVVTQERHLDGLLEVRHE